jgi:hypothetical protein
MWSGARAERETLCDVRRWLQLQSTPIVRCDMAKWFFLLKRTYFHPSAALYEA